MDAIAESAAGEAAGRLATYGGSGSAVIFGMQAEVFGMVAGLVIGLVGLCYQIWAGERRLKILANKNGEEKPA